MLLIIHQGSPARRKHTHIYILIYSKSDLILQSHVLAHAPRDHMSHVVIVKNKTAASLLTYWPLVNMKPAVLSPGERE